MTHASFPASEVNLMVYLQYSDEMLYNQLRYFLYLFDIEKARITNPGTLKVTLR
jgi:DNA Polymerase alpha zinc finger